MAAGNAWSHENDLGWSICPIFPDYQHYLESDSGKKFYSFLKNKYKDIKTIDDKSFFIGFERIFDFNKDIGGLEILNGYRANPGPFNGKIDEFTYDNWIANDINIIDAFGKLSSYRDFAQSQAGIKVFRNGFAVKPFGIDGDDWLRLRESQTTGGSYYPLRPANVIGYFAIDEGFNKELKDKTDREGLVSNTFSRNFFTLSFFLRDEINRYQEGIRRAFIEFLKIYKTENSGIKTVTQAFNQLKDTRNKSQEVKQEFNDALTTVENAITDSEKIVKETKNNPMFSTEIEKATASQVEDILIKLKSIQITLQKLEKVVDKTERLKEVIDILEPKIQIMEEQLSNFSELASLGLITESVSHEFNSISEKLSEKSSYFSNKLHNNSLSNSDIYILIEYINTTVNGLQVQLRHLDPALKYNREKKGTFKLSNFFIEEKDYYKNRFEKLGIKFSIEIVKDFVIKINKGKLIQVIDNLFNNSEYWLKERKRNDAQFEPKITVKVEEPWVYLFDNGFGIGTTVENHIFEAFVTTKPKGIGRGLGLFIVQQLLDSSGCTIALEPIKNEHDRKYIFALNLSNIISTK